MTLTDDVAEVILTLDDATMDEALQGTGGFTVTRDNHGKLDEVIIIYVGLTGSASVNIDFTTENLINHGPGIWRVDLLAGQNSGSVTLTPKKDNLIEGDETIVVTLLDGTPYGSDYIVGAQTTAEMTIVDYVEKIFLDGFED